MNIAVWFSCGAASAVAAKMTLELYGERANIRIVNNPIVEEHPDNQRFLKDVEAWLDHPIEFAFSSKYPSQSCVDVWDGERFMAGNRGAPCTRILKKQARQEWEAENPCDFCVLGFTYEEKKRADMFALTERDTLIPVLVNERITKAQCFSIIAEAGIKLPEIYHLGYPNANCIGCVKASSPTYWNHVRSVHPEVFDARAKQSREIGAKLVRVSGKRIFLDELDPSAKGHSMRTMKVECGIFCEEWKK